MSDSMPRIVSDRQRSQIIPIAKKSPTNVKEGFSVYEYGLTRTVVDPTKSSPPNEFMLKLKQRMSCYSPLKNSDNLIKEYLT